jgi:diguanylate cyclase (GGDEF)-like protein
VGPWPGFALAADAAVHDLHRRFGLDLWTATHVAGESQAVVASAGPWAELSPPGRAYSWPSTFCRRMVEEGAPVAVADVQRSREYGAVAVGPLAVVRSYVGMPLLSSEGRLFGTLCAFAGQPQPSSLRAVLESAQLLSRMLSTILAGEQVAADRSQDAAQAYALAERDRLTGLRNRRGWEDALLCEEQRSRHYGSAVSVLTLDVDGLKRVNDTAGHDAGDEVLATCARVLRDTCRPGDALARVDGDEFGVLAVECDAVSARVLASRLRVRLRAVGVAASLGSATRRPYEGLDETWHRAEEAMHAEKGRRHRRPSATPAVHGVHGPVV